MLNLPKQPTCIDFKIVMFTNFLNLLTIFDAQHNKYIYVKFPFSQHGTSESEEQCQ